MTRPFPERRRHPRAPADCQLRLRTAAPADAVPVRDISRAGLACHLDQPLPLFSQVALRLEVPEGEGRFQTVTGVGAVVRCAPAPRGAPGRYEVAIFFLEMSEADRQVLDRYVAARLPAPANPS